jgi:hypothetical protein
MISHIPGPQFTQQSIADVQEEDRLERVVSLASTLNLYAQVFQITLCLKSEAPMLQSKLVRLQCHRRCQTHDEDYLG